MPHIDSAVNGHLPIVFGEVANKQDETINGATQFCFYDLDGLNQNHPPQFAFTYQNLLQKLKTNEIGWLAWSWWPDLCSSRNIGKYNQNSNRYEGLSEPLGHVPTVDRHRQPGDVRRAVGSPNKGYTRFFPGQIIEGQAQEAGRQAGLLHFITTREPGDRYARRARQRKQNRACPLIRAALPRLALGGN